MISSSVGRARRFHQRYAPWIALGVGCVAWRLSHRGIDFAPKAVALLALAWTLPVAVGRWLPAHAAAATTAHDAKPGSESGARSAGSDPQLVQSTVAASSERRLVRSAGGALRSATSAVVMALFRNVLFFLVPVWFGSATVSSLNMLLPLLLAAMALFTCFPDVYRRRIVERPAARTAWSWMILFAALVPAAAVMFSLSPRWALVLSAAVAFLLTGAALMPRERLKARRSQMRIAAAAVIGGGVLMLIAPGLPPVPIVCRASASGIGVRDRAIEDSAEQFPAGTRRVYAWFAVTLPAVYRQGIHFQWYRNGDAVGRPISSTVTGGRKDGFRTWTYLTAPAPGRWRIDLLTDSSQLICRRSLIVEAGP